jgi:hypothetical protein
MWVDRVSTGELGRELMLVHTVQGTCMYVKDAHIIKLLVGNNKTFILYTCSLTTLAASHTCPCGNQSS